MNILKRIALIGTAGIMAAAMFTGCGKKDDKNSVVGEWECTNIKMSGMDMDVKQFAETMGTEFEMTLNFDEDGTVSITANGETEEEKYNKDSDILADEDGSVLKYDKASDTVVLTEEESDMEITFKRK